MSVLLITVVIPTYRRPDLLALCLAKLQPDVQTFKEDYEIIVSDDDTQAPSKNFLAARFPKVRWIQGPGRGPAANRNVGAAQARGEWLVFVDDDCLPEPGLLAAYAEHLKGEEILEGKIIADRAQERFDEESPTNEHGGYLWSCNFAVKRELFMNMGGFNEAYPSPAMEDVDFHVRAKQIVSRIPFVAGACVIHPWRRAKGFDFMSAKVKSLFVFWKLHPGERPSSVPGFFFRRAAQGLRRFPGECIRYRGRGAGHALKMIAFWLVQTGRAL